MKLDVNLAHVQLIVPPEVDARIGGDTTLGSLDVDTGRFVREDEHYVSKGFGESEHTLHLEVDCDLGRVRVR
jgi:hypothetical protein